MGNLWAGYALFITTLFIIAILFSFYIYIVKPNGIKKSIDATKDKLDQLSPTIKFLLLTVVIIIIIGFWMPFFLTRKAFIKEFDFTATGAIGDTFGGILNPFVALAAVIVTGLAFYMQYQANKQLQDQFKLQQFESQFYEMLKLHKENVNEMEIEGYEIKDRLSDDLASDCYSEESFRKSIDESKGRHNLKKPLIDQDLNKKQVKGRKIFYLMSKEISSVYQIIKKHYYNYCPQEFSSGNDGLELNEHSKYLLFYFAYDVFFSGKEQLEKDIKFKRVRKFINDESNNDQFHKDILKDLEVLRTCHKMGVRYLKKFNSKNGIKKSLHIDFSYKPFGGHQIRLAHYYRHMFALVKFVVNQPNEFLSYEDKRNYLKIFRAQLSNHEVVMLYYNWLGGYGEDWEVPKHLKKINDEGNRFFTVYRIIHNLNANLVLDEFNPEELFSNHEYDEFLFKKGKRDTDLLFEVHGIESSLSEEDNKRLQEL